jgi:hypothetical protein
MRDTPSDDRPVIEVEHQMTVRNQMNRTSGSARHWEQTGMSWGGCLCGWTAGTDGVFLPANVVAKTHCAAPARGRHGVHAVLTTAKASA